MRIKKFHQLQKIKEIKYIDKLKNKIKYKHVPINNLGIYVPANLPSTLLMNAIPANIAGVKNIVLANPRIDQKLDPAVMYVAKKCGIKKIIWIEALPEKQKILKKKLSNYSEMYFGNFAAGEKNCNLDFNIANNGVSSSLLEFDSHTSEHPEIKMISSVNVEMKKMDDYIEEINVNRKDFNFLLLDIQGYELNALRGMNNQLSFVDLNQS